MKNLKKHNSKAKKIKYLKKIKEDVYELTKDATFKQMFSDLGNKRKVWRDKEEVLKFAKQHKEDLGKGCNFFELKGGFVACVFLVSGGQPYVFDVYELSYDYVWSAECEHRIFSPQQTLKNLKFEPLELSNLVARIEKLEDELKKIGELLK